jgi:hypothetical protein
VELVPLLLLEERVAKLDPEVLRPDVVDGEPPPDVDAVPLLLDVDDDAPEGPTDDEP